jgi:hypothetical protein
MAISHLPIGPSEPCIFAIFESAILKFWIPIENYIIINDTIGFFDSFFISSEIELG